MANKNYNKIFSLTIFGAATCIILGLIVFGRIIFNVSSPLFAFVSGGITGAVAFAFFHGKKLRDAIFISILLFIIIYFSTGRQFFLTHLLYFTGIILSVFIYSKWIFNKLNKLIYVRPLILAGIFSIMFVVVYLFLSAIFYSHTIRIQPFTNMPIGFLIGLGLGIGFEISEYLKWPD